MKLFRELKRLTKYAVVGGIGAVITVYGNLGFQALGVPEYIDPTGFFPVPWALGFAVIAAFLSNYTLNALWTFQSG